MALVVEDGTGMATANSLVSVVEFTAYYTDRGNTEALAIDNKEGMLIQATDYLRTMYQWKHDVLVTSQSLPFPRTTVAIPPAIKEAVIILALKASDDDLISDEERRVVKEKVSTLEVEYDKNDTQVGIRYTAAEALVKPYLYVQSTSEVNHTIRRT